MEKPRTSTDPFVILLIVCSVAVPLGVLLHRQGQIQDRLDQQAAENRDLIEHLEHLSRAHQFVESSAFLASSQEPVSQDVRRRQEEHRQRCQEILDEMLSTGVFDIESSRELRRSLPYVDRHTHMAVVGAITRAINTDRLDVEDPRHMF